MEKLFNASYLQDAHQIEPEQIEALYHYGKIQVITSLCVG